MSHATLCHIDKLGGWAHKRQAGCDNLSIDSYGIFWYSLIMVNIKYLTKSLLQSLNVKALKGKFNRTLENLENLDAQLKYPVMQVFMSDDHIARCFIAVGPSSDQLTTVQLDMSLEDYDSLPVHKE